MGLPWPVVRRPSSWCRQNQLNGPNTLLRAPISIAPKPTVRETGIRVLWMPNPGPQTAFLACPYDWVLYGGQVGGGKTDALLADFLHQVHLPGYAGLFIRKSYPELLQVIRRSHQIYPALGGRYKVTEKTWFFPGGATLRFGYVTKYDDAIRYSSDEYQWIAIDECTHVPWPAIELLSTRLRASKALGLRCYLRLSANPNGRHMLDIRNRFIDGREPWKVYHDGKVTQVFIPARLEDTPQLAGTGYDDRLEVLGEAEKKALRGGDWYAYEGRVFTLTRGVHVWTWAEFEARTGHKRPPTTWRRYRCYDYGTAAPSACYWIALDSAPPHGTGRAIVYREDYTVTPDGKGGWKANKGLNLPPRDAAKRLARLSEGETYAGSWAGRDLFDDPRADTGNGAPIASHFQAEGVRFQAWKVGGGSRLAGKVALQQWLAPRADGAAGLVFIQEECEHALRTLPALDYAKNDPEQVDDSGEDHAFDALAGWAKMAPRPAVVTPPSGPRWMEAEYGAGARVS